MRQERDSRQLSGSLRDVSHLQSLSLPDVFSAILSTASIVDNRKSAALSVSNYAKNSKIILSKRFPWQHTLVKIRVLDDHGKGLWGSPEGDMDGARST